MIIRIENNEVKHDLLKLSMSTPVQIVSRIITWVSEETSFYKITFFHGTLLRVSNNNVTIFIAYF